MKGSPIFSTVLTILDKTTASPNTIVYGSHNRIFKTAKGICRMAPKMSRIINTTDRKICSRQVMGLVKQYKSMEKISHIMDRIAWKTGSTTDCRNPCWF